MASQMLFNDLSQQSDIVRYSPLKETETLSFFKNLYTYPPKFHIKIDQLEPVKTLPYKGKQNYSTRLPLNIKDYVKEYKVKQYTSTFYKERVNILKKALQNVPVYVVLNSNHEFILAQPIQNLSKDKKSNVLKETMYEFVSATNHISTSEERKLGLFFFNRKDAEMHLQTILSQDFEGVQRIGLALHCISLDSAYSIMRHAHSNIDFKFVPNLNELTTFLTKKTDNPKLIFDERQSQNYNKIRTVPLISNVGPLNLKHVTPFFSLIQNNEYFKGVPLYIVQYKNPPRNFKEKLQNYTYDKYFRSIIHLGRLTEAIYGRLIIARNFLGGCGKSSIIQGNIEVTQTSNNITNYAFFSIDQATQFIKDYEKLCKENKNLRTSLSTGIIPYAGSWGNTSLAPITLRPTIFVTNLEDFLERWEETLLLNKKDEQTIFNTKEIIFVPQLEMSNEFVPYKETPLTKFKNSMLVKYRKFKATFRVFTEA